MVDKEGFAAPVPCKTKALLGSLARGAVVEGVDDVEGGKPNLSPRNELPKA
jgi:hypothetical protein